MNDFESLQVILQGMAHKQRLCRHKLTHLLLYVCQPGGGVGQCLRSDA